MGPELPPAAWVFLTDPAPKYFDFSATHMARRVSTSRMLLAALLVALALVPNAVTVFPVVWYYCTPAAEVAWVQVECPMSPWPWFSVDAPSFESAKAIASGWQQFRRYSWILALVACLMVGRELLPIPRFFGRDED